MGAVTVAVTVTVVGDGPEKTVVVVVMGGNDEVEVVRVVGVPCVVVFPVVVVVPGAAV